MEMKTINEFLEFIKERKSIRNFTDQKIRTSTINEILECGRWAPSGSNSQPWRISVVTHPTVKRMLSELSKYRKILDSANVIVVVFLDLERGYDRVKDIQAIGAFMQNILLGVHGQENLGAVWIGEILNRKEEVNEIFKFPPDKYELMGCIAIGVIDNAQEEKNERSRNRRPLESFMDWF